MFSILTDEMSRGLRTLLRMKAFSVHSSTFSLRKRFFDRFLISIWNSASRMNHLAGKKTSRCQNRVAMSFFSRESATETLVATLFSPSKV
jgi:hypothetical protein